MLGRGPSVPPGQHGCRRPLVLWSLPVGHGWGGGDRLSLHGTPQKTKLTFLRCAVLLKWEFRKELFGKLAWGRGLGAENDIFIYVVRRQHPPDEMQGARDVAGGCLQSGSSGGG